VAISYKDNRHTEGKRVRLGPFLLALAALAALIAFAPETAKTVESTISAMLALPRF
jgi:hypothetical protein